MAPGGGARFRGPRWVDLEIARRRAIAADPNLAHDSVLHRQPRDDARRPPGRGLRVEALADLVEGFAPRGVADDDAVLDAGDLAFGPPILRPPSFRDFYAFERHVRTMWERRGQEIPEAWYRLPIFYFSNVSELRGPGDPVWAPRGSVELDYELEVGALIDTPAIDLAEERGEEAIGGYFIVNDWSARDLQRDESTLRLGPGEGQGLRRDDRAVAGDARRAGGPAGGRLDGPRPRRWSRRSARTTAGRSRPRAGRGRAPCTRSGRWPRAPPRTSTCDRASSSGSGTVGGGCLLEIREETLGRYLEPGDEVTLEIERFGRLVTPVVARPA